MLSKQIREKLPFISIIKYGNEEYVGIIANQDQNVTIMYVYTFILSNDSRKKLLELGRIWWDESNRKIPIDIFLKGEMTQFQKYSIIMNTKDVTLIDGPCPSLESFFKKGTKKKSIRLFQNKK